MNVIELRYDAYQCFRKASESSDPVESARLRDEGDRLSERADKLQRETEAATPERRCPE